MIYRVRVGEKPLVLLVEDEPDVRRIIHLQLTELGYPVIEAANGTEATRMIENVPDIGVLVTDMVMPGGLGGWETGSPIRKARNSSRPFTVPAT